MDGSQSTPVIASTPAAGSQGAPVAQAGGAENETGFARLFELIQRKATALISGEQQGDQPQLAGNDAPEDGNALPLQFDYRNNPALNKPRTAVLATTETRNRPLKDAVLEENEIAPLDSKLEIEGHPLALESVMPKINLPQVDASLPDASEEAGGVGKIDGSEGLVTKAGANDPAQEIIEIPPVAKIRIPERETAVEAAASTRPVETTMPEADTRPAGPENVATVAPAKPAEGREVDSRIVFDNALPDSNRTGATAVSAAADAAPAAAQPVVIGTEFSNGGELGGINALDRELREGRYADSTVQTAGVDAAKVSGAGRRRVELSRLEVRPLTAEASQSAETAPALVNAAFLQSSRQVANAPAMQTFAVEQNPTSVKAERDIKAIRKLPGSRKIDADAFEKLWEKSQPVSSLSGLHRASGNLEVRPLDPAVGGSAILHATDAHSLLTTKPSLATQPLHSASLATPAGMPATVVNIRQNGWEASLANNVTWMANHHLKTVQVAVSPADLGPIHLHAAVDNDQLNLQIQAHHGVTREALEAALPRLRELLNGGQFASVNVDVSNGGFDNQKYSESERAPRSSGSAGEDTIAQVETGGSVAASGRAAPVGLVDMFA